MLLLIIIALCYNYPKKIKNLAFSNDLEINLKKKNDKWNTFILKKCLASFLLTHKKKKERITQGTRFFNNNPETIQLVGALLGNTLI